ncbi:PPOX class F420-dependent oxidoreductase [Actinoplanes cyaneus]|uniref:PPOX class F420-dependent oxidoreductase n=1 Tax=Actinoplanes cyaneus TaxID=52696 RepID=A0A919IRW0_9ACTN|nr:PPOX class F420-dependent oxidoreductase [Actinoplanes cyaneus]MCW2139741.1 pyridoxamine 5'-phosphate oxidase family protein [Actinoplanes cyaneus]GID69896.1 PPOX class F420-dependent oxidoreductase [Actinoplanes cyaneus]
MTIFTDAEREYLQSGPSPTLLARIATVGSDGMPHVAPVGWRFDAERQAIEIGGTGMGQSKKFRDVARSGRAAIVIDDVLPPWQPRGIEIRGRAEAVDGPDAYIRIVPQRITAWGLDGRRNARDVPGTS